jgi:hypothetical protein
MSNQQLEVIYRPIDTLILDSENPRLHSRRQIGQIARSIETFGFNVPILVSADLKVIAGHGRVLASRELRTKEIPTICIDHLSPEKIRAYAIADNKLTENGAWNEELLANHFRELSALEINFSLDVTGFEIGEIDFLIESEGKSEATEDDAADDLQAIPSGPPVCKAGDIWLLGQHRVFCGNSLESASYTALTKGEKADLVFTDPPYNVRIDGHASGLGKTRHREFAMATGEMGRAEFTDFLTRVCLQLKRFSQAGAIHFICMDWRHAGELLAAGNEIYPKLKNICVWVKHNAGMGSFYRSQHELVFVFKTGARSHRNNIQLGKHGRHRTNVWPIGPPMILVGRRTKAICFRCIQRLSPSLWSQMRSLIAQAEATWCSIRSSEVVPPLLQRKELADDVLESRLIPCMSTPSSGDGRRLAETSPDMS